MSQFRNKLYDMLAYVKEKCPGVEIEKEAVGMVEENQWIMLGLRETKPVLIVADLQTKPRRVIILPINDTVSYWCARNVLARNAGALRHASERAKEIQKEKLGGK